VCGVSGVMVLNRQHPGQPAIDIASAMAETMVHRGPDSSGTWCSEEGDLAFGHRRLAIVDLTPAGHQPMSSADGRWTITYNGELYNTGAVRQGLAAPPNGWRGHSDTEVLIESIASVGVDATLDRVIGMFAFAAYDHRRDELWLARDRFGEKPLYYRSTLSMFAFASELRALTKIPAPTPDIDRDSLVELLERSAISAPHTIYESVYKLMPGSRVRVSRDGAIEHRPYYDPSSAALAATPTLGSDDETIEQFEQLLSEIVASRMVSDVPLGAFLSGGVDFHDRLRDRGTERDPGRALDRQPARYRPPRMDRDRRRRARRYSRARPPVRRAVRGFVPDPDHAGEPVRTPDGHGGTQRRRRR
jgi:asparagine synthase (glutamine-hydrolysing)